MPAKSKKQQRLFAIAKHNPSALYAKNKGVLKAGMKTIAEFAQTKRSGLPLKVKKRK